MPERARASVAAHTRRDRSVSAGANARYFARQPRRSTHSTLFPRRSDSIIYCLTSPKTTAIISTTVGAILPLEGQLIPSASSNVNLDSSAAGHTASASANYGNTGLFFVDILTPGASYETASGQTYFSPAAVPEAPSLALLLGSAVIWAAARTFDRRRSSYRGTLRISLPSSPKEPHA
jgi:hypothetical protein